MKNAEYFCLLFYIAFELLSPWKTESFKLLNMLNNPDTSGSKNPHTEYHCAISA